MIDVKQFYKIETDIIFLYNLYICGQGLSALPWLYSNMAFFWMSGWASCLFMSRIGQSGAVFLNIIYHKS